MTGVRSILDNDLYKFTMQNFAMKLFPGEIVRYTFINRDRRQFPKGFAGRLRAIVHAMADLAFSAREHVFVRQTCRYFDPSYLAFLKAYRFNPDEVFIAQVGGNLQINIEGPWYRAILWEVPLLATISALYFQMTKAVIPSRRVLAPINRGKAETFAGHNIRFADFGTRRRFSFANHVNVVEDMIKYGKKSFVGTSNLRLALDYGLEPVGTQAHELFSLLAAIYGFGRANRATLLKWHAFYGGQLAIALADTFTSDFFMASFSPDLMAMYQGVRQDSGDPIAFADKFIAHYKNAGIESLNKRIVFSDALDTDKVLKIEKHCKGQIGTAYGIGTFLSNDLPGVTPLNIVIKLVGRKKGDTWLPVIKLTDDKNKSVGECAAIRACRAWIARARHSPRVRRRTRSA